MKLHGDNESFGLRLLLTLIWLCVNTGVKCQDNTGVPSNPCAVTLCPANTMCIEIPDPRNCNGPHQTNCPKTARCIPTGNQMPTNPCDAARCPENTRCIAVPDPNNCGRPGQTNCPMTAKCIPSDNGGNNGGPFCGQQRCQPGQRCEYVQVQCIRAPCPPILQCVPQGEPPSNPCYAAYCPANTMCIAVPDTTNCGGAPQQNCPLTAKCVPTDPNNNGGGPMCGTQLCQLGQRCEQYQVQCVTTPCLPAYRCVPPVYYAQPLAAGGTQTQ